MKKVRKMLIYFVYRTGQEKGLVNWQKYRALCKYVNWETVMKKRKSVEKIAAVLLMAGYIGITGGYGNFEAVDIVVKAENLEKENEESQDMEEMLSQTDSIELTDEIAGFYSTDFSCMLSEEEVGLLKDIMPEQQEITTANKRSTYYQMIFRNKKGEILDRWKISTKGEGIVTSDLGSVYKRQEKLEKWLDQIEEEHNISYASVYDRMPGENYGALLERAKSGTVSEITENNFIKPKTRELTETDIEELQKMAADLHGETNATRETDYHYQIVINDEEGRNLYIWWVYDDGTVCTDMGYPIAGEKLSLWVKRNIPVF